MRYPIHYAETENQAFGVGMRDTTALCGKHITGYELETGAVKVSHGEHAYITCTKCLAILQVKKEAQHG